MKRNMTKIRDPKERRLRLRFASPCGDVNFSTLKMMISVRAHSMKMLRPRRRI